MCCFRCCRNPTTRDAYRLSIASIIITFFASWAGIHLWTKTDSTLCLVFGLENVVDFITSSVVLWRFFAPTSTIDDIMERKLRQREIRASVAVSFLMILLGIFISITSLIDLSKGQETIDEEQALFSIAFLSIFFFGTLTVLKFQYATHLDSPSLYKDGLCSLIGTILAIALCFDTLIVVADATTWWIDPIVALLCGTAAILIGVMAVHKAYCKDGMPIFAIEWWTTNKDEQENNNDNNNNASNNTNNNDNVELPPTGADGDHQIM